MKSAVVLVSGGLDSATVLAIAKAEGWECHALSVDYGQRHKAELHAATQIARALGAVEHRVAHVGLGLFGGSALTDASIDVPIESTGGIPITYVPARNTVFLSLALAHAEVTGSDAVFTGANAVDYSGYPDCRPEYLAAFEAMANLATKRAVEGSPIAIRAPIVRLSKADIVRRGHELGVDFALTVSCYNADAAGRACAQCDACRFRREGFATAGLPDPTRYQPGVT
ncbi:7-cyano-7-deazaguanine synthase [Usitatibacter rugosus]|uniref:7-cyano-7-deazaguanine synthase n=1 Tax=Usitatibacter rugosus TaxID=2732067 RepID=A0A6M4GTY1_9PROT|nr:7-cyano-7-deazaguanine synthase QueC [Usitatibacter rugosus]QJR10308.1 7-cyano-7-deazaguanine synthase [Usitatibacter rugosus]